MSHLSQQWLFQSSPQKCSRQNMHGVQAWHLYNLLKVEGETIPQGKLTCEKNMVPCHTTSGQHQKQRTQQHQIGTRSAGAGHPASTGHSMMRCSVVWYSAYDSKWSGLRRRSMEGWHDRAVENKHTACESEHLHVSLQVFF